MLGKLLLLGKISGNYFGNIETYAKTKKDLRPKAPMVFFNLNSRRTEPYYYVLIFSFHEAGYTVILRHSVMFIGNCFKAGQHIFELPRLKIKCSLPKNLRRECVLISDHSSRHSRKRWKKIVNIDFDVYSEKNTDSTGLTMPFHMSPEQYISGRFRRVDALRDYERTMSIFFSGNQDREAYTHSIFKVFFQKLNRIQIIDTLTDALENDKLVLIESKDQWSLLEGSFCNKFVLNHWIWSPTKSKNLESRVANEEWLATLAQSDFFLATPGIRMPLCFNVVEAMAVGTIPILQYPEYFDPPLEHLKNCIVFESKVDLVDRVRIALMIEKDKLIAIRKEVTNYYDKYLRPESVAERVTTNSASHITLYVNATEVSYQAYLKNELKRV